MWGAPSFVGTIFGNIVAGGNIGAVAVAFYGCQGTHLDAPASPGCRDAWHTRLTPGQ